MEKSQGIEYRFFLASCLGSLFAPTRDCRILLLSLDIYFNKFLRFQKKLSPDSRLCVWSAAGGLRNSTESLVHCGFGRGFSFPSRQADFLSLVIGSEEWKYAYFFRADLATRDFAISLFRLASVALLSSFMTPSFGKNS